MRRQKIIKTGNSLAMTVPADFVKTVGIRAGQKVRVEVKPISNHFKIRNSGTRQLPLSTNLTRRRKIKR